MNSEPTTRENLWLVSCLKVPCRWHEIQFFRTKGLKPAGEPGKISSGSNLFLAQYKRGVLFPVDIFYSLRVYVRCSMQYAALVNLITFAFSGNVLALVNRQVLTSVQVSRVVYRDSDFCAICSFFCNSPTSLRQGSIVPTSTCENEGFSLRWARIQMLTLLKPYLLTVPCWNHPEGISYTRVWTNQRVTKGFIQASNSKSFDWSFKIWQANQTDCGNLFIKRY